MRWNPFVKTPNTPTSFPPEHAEGTSFRVGGIYSFREDEHTFIAGKILAVDKTTLHLRLYRNTFETRPTEDDVAHLTMGSLDDAEGVGVKHFPMGISSFLQLKPLFLAQDSVRELELHDYFQWKQGSSLQKPLL